MKLVLHIGMPKTGSSSLQETLFSQRGEGVCYLPWRRANHGDLVSAFFEPHPERHPVFANKPNPLKAIEAVRSEWAPAIRSSFQGASAGTMVISAERLFITQEETLWNLFDFFAPAVEKIEVIGYVRAPVSYLQSALQQNIKTRSGPVTPAEAWPHYEKNFSKFDRVFGAHNVTLVPFNSPQMIHSDIVLDFLARIGASVDKANIVRDNASLSLEAMALSYARLLFLPQRPLGANPAFAERQIVNLLQSIGSKRVKLARAMVNPILSARSRDLDWIEDRIDQPIRDLPEPDPKALKRMADLIPIALDSLPELWAKLDVSERTGGRGRPGRADIGDLIETLKLMEAWAEDRAQNQTSRPSSAPQDAAKAP